MSLAMSTTTLDGFHETRESVKKHAIRQKRVKTTLFFYLNGPVFLINLT